MATRPLMLLCRTVVRPISQHSISNIYATSLLVRRDFSFSSHIYQQPDKAEPVPSNKPDAGKPSKQAVTDANLEEVIRSRIDDIRSGDFKQTSNPNELKHFRNPPAPTKFNIQDPTMVPRDADSLDQNFGNYAMPHPIWSQDEVHSIEITHKKPKGIIDNMAYSTVRLLRGSYDLISGYNRKPRNEKLWLNRIIFLETVAGVPGMVAAMVRHLHSLRKLRRDHGWIHTLLEEAENERMHLMTAMQLKQPSIMFRTTVMGAQGLFVTLFSLAYLLSPRYCHRFVGYLEEEAVITYTKCLKDIDSGLLQHWKTQPAPLLAKNYWNLAPAATMLDVILAIRADEAHHRVVNHTFASMSRDDFNPYKPGE